MKKIALATMMSLSLIASASSFAMKKPEKCPSASALQNVMFEVAEQVNPNGGWAVGVLKSEYDTNDTWTFVLYGIDAKNSEDALKKGNDAVKNISFSDGPVAIQTDMWLCKYTTQGGYQAVTYTPAYNGNKRLLMSIK